MLQQSPGRSVVQMPGGLGAELRGYTLSILLLLTSSSERENIYIYKKKIKRRYDNLGTTVELLMNNKRHDSILYPSPFVCYYLMGWCRKLGNLPTIP